MPNGLDLRALLGAAGGGPGAAPGPGPGGVGMFPPGLDQTGQLGLAALDRLTQKDRSGELTLDRIKQALELAQKLIVASLPLVSQWNAKMAKDLHVIGRQLADARINLTKEVDVGPPPEALLAGVQGTGLPGGL